MTSMKPISAPRHTSSLNSSSAWLLATLATGLLIAAFAFSARPQVGPEPLATKHGRKLAAGAPVHAAVHSGKVLAAKSKFAPVALRGSQLLANAPTSIGPESRTHGRTIALGAPIHRVVTSGKVLAPTTKFAPVVPRGGRAASDTSKLEPRASESTSGHAAAGTLLM
jgi:hypothetical protein